MDIEERRDRLRARWRRKNHERRAILRASDVTADWERRLRAQAKRCPVCSVQMTVRPQLPNSKELDHIVPLCVGGTHTVGNVRIICRSCNLARPMDGSDYVGPVGLWAQDETVAASLQAGRPASRPMRREVKMCQPRPSRRDDGRRAAEMRAAGSKWREIADALSFTNTGSAYLCAEKWGDPEVVAMWRRPTGQR